MSFSLVLATLGRCDELDRLIDSLLQQTQPPLELIVVDQNSDGRLLPLVQRAVAAGLTVQHLRSAPGLSRARNHGLRAARGELVAFPDDDCWYEPDTLAQACAALQERPDWAGLVAHWCEQSAASAATRTQGDPRLSHQRWRQFKDGDASSISLFLRKSLLDKLGGFDESLGLGTWFGAGEETDLVLRALGAGAQLVRCPQVRVHHLHPAPGSVPRANDWRSTLRRARGTGALYSKHRLPLWVVLRGLVAPALKALWARPLAAHMAHGLAASAGRWQGQWRWRRGNK